MEDYRDLVVWQKSMELVKIVYALSKQLPKEETFALSNQLRRAVISIPSNIAEGYGRNSTQDYLRFLNIEKKKKNEVETQLQICLLLEYMNQEEIAPGLALCKEVSKMLNALIHSISYKQE